MTTMAFVAFAAIAASSTEPSRREELDAAIDAYRQSDFSGSISRLERLFQDSTDAREKALVLLNLGLNFLALGNERKTQELWHTALDFDAALEPPILASPRVRKLFVSVRDEHLFRARIIHVPPEEIRALAGARLEMRAAPLGARQALRVHVRKPGGQWLQMLPESITEGDERRFVLDLSPAFLRAGEPATLEYFIVVIGPTGEISAQAGGEGAPLRVSIAQPASAPVVEPWFKKWWVWTLVGAVAIGGATTAAVVATTTRTGGVEVRLSF